jgi:nicotinate dehydrogenase subunit B
MTLPSPLLAAPLVRDWIRFADRRVQVLSGRVELGQGNLTAMLRIAAEESDVAPAEVAITGADTELTPNEGFTSGNMSIMAGGMSIRLAASAARHLPLAEAGRRLRCTPDDLAIEARRGG